MNTIFLLCQCDSLVTTVCGNSIPVVITKTYEAGTNVQDVTQNTAITFFICVATVIVAEIVRRTVLSWKDRVIKAKKDEREFQMTKDKEEAQRKQKADLLGKYLDFLKEQTNEKDYISIEKYEEQRKFFMKELLQLIQDKDKSVYNDCSMTENLIKKLNEYIDAEKPKPTTIDQNKIDRYRKTLEYLIRLSQKDMLNEFSEEKLEALINNEKKEQKGPVA